MDLCELCGTPVGEGGSCPGCGGAICRHIDLEVGDQLDTHDGVRVIYMDPTRPSKSRGRIEVRDGEDLRRSQGDYVNRARLIDKDADHYSELVTDKAGTVIRQVDEPLSEHRGHGSDRLRREAKGDG